jgi:hypothetical protein
MKSAHDPAKHACRRQDPMIRPLPEPHPQDFFAEMDVDSSKSPLNRLNSFHASFPECMDCIDRHVLFS